MNDQHVATYPQGAPDLGIAAGSRVYCRCAQEGDHNVYPLPQGLDFDAIPEDPALATEPECCS